MKGVLISILSLSMLTRNLVFSSNGGYDYVFASSTQIQNEKVRIKREELPEAAKKILSGDSFKGWIFLKAYKLANGEFEVDLRKGSAFQTVEFDNDGKLK